MTRRLIREEALRIAVDAFKGRQNEKADQSRIVPDSAKFQRTMKSSGRYVVPEYENSVHDDMTRERPSTKYGQQVFGPGYEEYSEPDEYALHRGISRNQGEDQVTTDGDGSFCLFRRRGTIYHLLLHR